MKLKLLSILLGLSSTMLAEPIGSIFYSSNVNAQLLLNGTTLIGPGTTGWFTSTGDSNGGSGNYITGLCSDCGGDTYRGFFIFNVSFDNTITSAELLVDTFTYDSLNATETLILSDYSGTVANLLSGSVDPLGIYTDLGTGTVYGTRVYSAADADQVRSISLNAAAIAALQSAADNLTPFTMGASLDENTSAVPEPSTLLSMGAGLGVLALVRRRKSAVSR